ncbi:MAG: RimK family alpha-L-glutamate ligase [Clostridiales bacterium]|nr:RimK family alpha-L-glutamate ligase [Clostridiales bacterium]
MDKFSGILAVNHFLHGEKFDRLHAHLVKSARKSGIHLDVKTNLELACQKSVNADFVLFWDKDVNLALHLEKQGVRVFNSASSIAKCDDKARTYIELDGIVPQPETLIAPKCYYKSDMTDFVSFAVKELGLPLVFKECFGSFGMQVYLCGSEEEIFSHISEKPFLLQKFITESVGRDRRLEIVNSKCVCAVLRENKNDFRSNVTNGGTMTPYAPSEEEIQKAVLACDTLGLTFGGVDILENGDVCEVNSNAHIINIMQATGLDIAPMIFNTILEKIK